MNSIQMDKGLTEIILTVELFEEFGSHIAYAPSLDLAGEGDTPEAAIACLKSITHETIEWCRENVTLNEMLLDHGWTIRKLPEPFYAPPVLDRKLKPGYQTTEVLLFA